MSFGEPIGVGKKDPDDISSFTIDWADWLSERGDRSIGGSTWALSSTGITASASTYTSTTTTIVVSGGTSGATYKLLNRITTSTSTGAVQLQQDRTVHVNVLQR